MAELVLNMPEYIWNITLKIPLRLDSIYKRDAFRNVSNVQDGDFVKMFNMLL